MKLPTAKFELAVAPLRDKRLSLCAPYFDKAREQVVATNGHILAVVKVAADPDDYAGHIPLDALKRARSKDGNNEIALNGSAITGGATFQRPDVGPFPDYVRLVPAKPERAPDITLDADELYTLARAICDGKRAVVSLWLNGPETAVYVEPLTGSNVGVIMPCRRKD